MARRQFTELATIDEGAVQILEYQPAANMELAGSLVGMRARIEEAARNNVLAATNGEHFSETEMQAMVTIESLKQVGGLELTAVLLRAYYLRAIQAGNMIANHPGGYTSLNEMAEDNGLSVAELSQTIDLVNIIFPFIQNNLGIPVAQLWEQVGKSKLRELVPVLKVIITGTPSDTATTQAGADAAINDTAATLLAAAEGEPFRVLNELALAGDNLGQRRTIMLDHDLENEAQVRALQDQFDERVRVQTVDRLVHDGIHLNVRQLRNRLRPEHTENIQATVIPSGNQRLFVAVVDNDQYLLMQRKLGTHMDEQVFNLPEDPRQRQIEAARVREIRMLQRLLEAAE